MPIYEYVCKKCTKHFEVLKTSASDNETVKCLNCESFEVTKLISSSNFRMNSSDSSIPCGAPSGCPSTSGFS